MNVLALDIATTTGFCTSTASGIWDLSTKRDESKGMSLIRLKAKLEEVIRLERINLVVFERSAGMHKSSVISQSEKHGVVKLYLEENKINYRAYSAGEIKKHATGKGNSGKPAMLKAARDKWPNVVIVDDNQADAMFLYDLACSDLGL